MKKLHPIVFRYDSGGILLGKHKATVVLDNQTRIHFTKVLNQKRQRRPAGNVCV